ncbi:inhibitor of growth protein 4 isoform X1 [Malurus melanocephalus]|uniref:inhibitor of growth protein 4 isoform X1 n=2 Tax=Malurus melanocephalus TaxID=175006 RepID=UPI002548A481|nr:inhibitor of growth protein 4 isoform X1 [Malurus melanocephalus]
MRSSLSRLSLRLNRRNVPVLRSPSLPSARSAGGGPTEPEMAAGAGRKCPGGRAESASAGQSRFRGARAAGNRRKRRCVGPKMAAGMYLEHYLDSIENLPFELQRNFQLMRDLDQRTEDLKSEIDKLASEYISNARTLSSEEKLGLLKQIQEAYGKCKEFGDDKVQLAMQTYEMVDKHIRRLDTDLARFEADLKEKQIESSDYDSSSSKGKKKGRAQKEKKAARARSKGKNSDEEAPKTAQKKLKLVRTTEYGMPSVTFGNVHPSDVLDMPVDPNEPTYCLCHQVSYGEMIGCDNPDCSIEWFHFACVGLTTKPRGKWFCPRCSQERKKK